MSYQLAYTKRALKDIQSLSIGVLDKYCENPFGHRKDIYRTL